MKKIIFIFTTIFMFVFSACTDNFLETNTHPYQVSDASLQQDFNNLGAFYPSMLGQIFGNQVDHNLTNVAYVRHLGTPTPFRSNINNTTYFIRWSGYWNRQYNNVFAPAREVIAIAEADGEDVFIAWAKLIRVLSASRVSAYYGPIIYSDYGSPEKDIFYDDEPTLYNTWFTELDEIVSTLSANLDYPGLKNFDASFGGDVSSWLKYANSLRLQLAIRISKVDPALAKTQGEKAISDAGGLITSNDDNFMINNYGAQFHPSVICFNWGDTRMSATMESVLVGYEDSRIEKYFDPATDDSLYPDHPNWPYKGIHAASTMGAKGDRLSYSTIHSSQLGWTERAAHRASDVLFNLAEAALRGWSGVPGTAQQNYEAGVRASFAEWGAGGVDDYLMDDAKLPINYDDPKAEGEVNDFVSRWTVSVKWDDAADNEVKLDKIMTQKWIASMHNDMEIWCDHRRTGYPKLPYNYRNDSGADFGVIAADDFLRRLNFTPGERTNNPTGVADATEKLGGPDEIGTRLWWDTGGPNFP